MKLKKGVAIPALLIVVIALASAIVVAVCENAEGVYRQEESLSNEHPNPLRQELYYSVVKISEYPLISFFFNCTRL